MSIAKRIKAQNTIINRAQVTLARSSNPAHIEAAHSKIYEAEDTITALREKEEAGPGI